MGAFVSYLHLAHGINNFFVLAPNLTIYNKLIADFTPNTPKYVFKGIAEFATDPPTVITGDTYESGVGVRAINDPKSILGLELTATPFVETDQGPIPFKNVIYDYALSRAMADGFVKEPAQLVLDGFAEKQDIAQVVAKTAQLIMDQTIDIPRILVVPKGEVKSGFKAFTLELEALKYQAVSEELWIQHLRTDHREVLAMGKGGIEEERLEDYVVSGLIDFNDISYDDHADLLYDLAGQTVRHFHSYLAGDDTRKVLRCHQREIARFIHVQMQKHFWEEEGELEVKISCGFTELRQSAYAHLVAEPTADYRISPPDKSNMARYLFGGFARCLFPTQKFESEAERRLAVILERDALKWFRPARGQFQIYYRQGTTPVEYQPDFVAETDDTIFMLEPKASNQINDPVVLAKKESALKWCAHASNYTAGHGGKPWKYALIPHDEIAVNMTLDVLAKRFTG